MKTEKTIFRIESQVSDDGHHRYSYMKQWDKRKKMATVITIFPGARSIELEDLTTMLITNELVAEGYGGFYLVNLFSRVALSQKSLGNVKNLNDDVSNEVILSCADVSSVVIIAWGSVEQLKLGETRAKEIMAILEPYHDKVKYLTDAEGQKNYHPLAPKIKHNWVLASLDNW